MTGVGSTGAPLLGRAAARWLAPVALGALLGGAIVTLEALLPLPPLAQAARRALELVHRSVGPVWVPMALAASRVAWLAARALRTRAGRGRLGEPVRPELGQIAPVFAALGLCGTVWGLARAFEALNGGEFLEELPLLLGGLGAAMTSTLVGLGLQIATLLLAVINPAWSWLEVGWSDGETRLRLDRRPVGDAEQAVAVVRARAPEALCVAFDRGVPAGARAAIARRMWAELDGAVPLREVQR